MPKEKIFTDKQINRLAEPGYYIEYYNVKLDIKDITDFSVIYIGKGKCEYIHFWWGEDWCTLTWTCAPTKKKVNKQNDFFTADNDKSYRYLYFKTHAELVAGFNNLKLKPYALVKAKSDI